MSRNAPRKPTNEKFAFAVNWAFGATDARLVLGSYENPSAGRNRGKIEPTLHPLPPVDLSLKAHHSSLPLTSSSPSPPFSSLPPPPRHKQFYLKATLSLLDELLSRRALLLFLPFLLLSLLLSFFLFRSTYFIFFFSSQQPRPLNSQPSPPSKTTSPF